MGYSYVSIGLRKPGFVTTDEAMCAMDLLQAYEDMDETRLKKCIANQVRNITAYAVVFLFTAVLVAFQTFEFLDPPVARVARALKLIQKESILT